MFERLADKIPLIIVYRLSTIVNYDRIVVINPEGKIAEIGNHKQLMLVKGRYYKLWTRQNEYKGD